MAATPTPLPAVGRCEYPVVGVVAVMIGAFISTLNVRITTQGLADIRGALGLGFDEGSWISTIFSAAQMVVTPAAAWMSTVLSTRRVLLWTGAIFALASLPPPLVHDYDTLIALQFVRGLAVGAFIPAALGFVLRSLAPQWWIWGIAAYAFRFRLFAEYRQRARGVVFGDRALGMDLLAERGADAGDDAAHRRRNAAPADRPRIAAPDRLGRHRLCRYRLRPHLCRPRSGQPARLVQFRGGDRASACRRHARRRLSGARGPRRIPADPSAACWSSPMSPCRRC